MILVERRPLFLTSLLFHLAIACGKVEAPVSRKDEAVEALNARRFEDAISILSELHAENQADGEISYLLATAYAGSTGFNVVDAFEAFEPALFKSHEAKKKGAELVEEQTAANDLAVYRTDLEKSSVRFLQQVSLNFATLADIPYVESARRERLVEALLLVDKIDKGNLYYVRGRAYGSLLNALQFLNYVRDAVQSALVKDSVTFLDLVCALQVRIFLENLEISTGYLLNSIADLNLAFKAHEKTVPENLSLLKDAATHVQQVYQQNKGRFSEADLLFEATKKAYCD